MMAHMEGEDCPMLLLVEYEPKDQIIFLKLDSAASLFDNAPACIREVGEVKAFCLRRRAPCPASVVVYLRSRSETFFGVNHFAPGHQGYIAFED